MNSLKKKIILIFGLVSLLIILSIVSINTFFSERYISDEINRALSTNVANNALLMEEVMGDHFNYMETLSEHPEIYYNNNNPLEYTDREWTRFAESFHPQMERKNYVRMFLSDDEANSYRLDSERVHVDVSTREYYQIAMGGEPNISDVLIGAASGEAILIIAQPIERQNQIKGILYSVINHEGINEISDQLTYGETGFSYIINGNGDIITSPNPEHINEQLNLLELARESSPSLTALLENNILQGETGVGRYTFDGNDRIAGYTPIDHPYLDWYIITVINEDEVFSGVTALRNIGILVGLISIIIVVIIIYFIGDYISKPIKVLTKKIEYISNYDLSQDNSDIEKYEKYNDEIGVISKSIEALQKNLSLLIGDTSEKSELVASSSEELSASTEESSKANNEVFKTIDDIAKGATEQAEDTERAATNIADMGSLVEKDESYRKDLNESVNKINVLKEEGIHIIKELVNNTNLSNEASKDIMKIIENTNSSALDIENKSTSIKTIAEQTNLLALNASIEAARAGESGRGFAVVAEEIRKLAEESNSFAEEIESIIKTLNERTEYGVKRMNEVRDIVSEQTNNVDTTNDKFNGISDSIKETMNVLNKLNESGNMMTIKKNEIVEVIESLSAIAEENAAGTEEVSASVEEQSASIEQISSSSQQLAKLAEEMQANVSKFKLK